MLKIKIFGLRRERIEIFVKEETLASHRRRRPSLLRQSSPLTVCHRTVEPIATQPSRRPQSSVSSADNLRGSEANPRLASRFLPPTSAAKPVVASRPISHIVARRAPVVEAREAQSHRASTTRAAQLYPTASPLCVNSSDPHRAAPELIPAFQAELISTFQAEQIPAFLVEPICLSFSRQPAPVLAPILPIRVVPAWMSFVITTYLGLRSPTGPPVWHGYRYDSSDSTGSSQPDCLRVSSGFATDQYVLGAPSGHQRLDSVPTGAHVARVRERARYWVGAEVRARASWRVTRSDRGEP
ncbi:hypothetical protein E6C27_scaffold83G00890 [Cucumis melo var. makuwa]|uniref:Uncharacterized protein n=1 Tax=Cucumis melo var. makuwa TaxID=1194695 RepID=A0A5A7U0N5_CUCMM|nr:hypothetical protein E6C27_scaffold83G00890 [Cucumis melo var. makuwa]